MRAKALDDVPHRLAAADAAGPRQRLPARLHREHGGFRQPARARRQFRGAVDRRSSSPSSAPRTTRAAPPCSSIVLLGFTLARVLRAARLARQARLHDGHRQGRFRPAAARCRAASPGSATASRSRGRPSPSWSTPSSSSAASCAPWGRDYTADARALPDRLSHRADGARAVLLRLGLEFVLGRRSRSRRSRRRSPPPIGLLTAYLLTRQNFAGRRAFEFGTMLSFAIPGTVDRRLLHPRLQRAADRDHRHRASSS